MNYTIFYPTPLSEISDITNDNIDVCVHTEDGQDYTFTVVTPKNLNFLMENEHFSYLSPDFRFLTVTMLTESAITEVIDAVMANSKLAKWYGEN